MNTVCLIRGYISYFLQLACHIPTTQNGSRPESRQRLRWGCRGGWEVWKPGLGGRKPLRDSGHWLLSSPSGSVVVHLPLNDAGLNCAGPLKHRLSSVNIWPVFCPRLGIRRHRGMTARVGLHHFIRGLEHLQGILEPFLRRYPGTPGVLMFWGNQKLIHRCLLCWGSVQRSSGFYHPASWHGWFLPLLVQ